MVIYSLENTRNGIYKSKKYRRLGIEFVKMKELFNSGRFKCRQISFDKIQLSEKEISKLHLRNNDLLVFTYFCGRGWSWKMCTGLNDYLKASSF